MIVTSAVLVATALGLLVAGILLPMMLLVYVSIAVSILAALLLGVGAFLRRGELFGSASKASGDEASESTGETTEESAAKQPAMSAAGASGSEGTATALAADGPADESSPAAGTGADIPGDTPVLVVPSRGTYHVTSCRKTRTRTSAEMTYREARAEGHTPCSSCLPDTVLAARGSVSATGAEPDEPDETADIADAGEAAESTDDAQAGLVGVVDGSHRYHRLTCAVVEDAVQDGIELATMGREEAETKNCTPCTVCRP